jgi:hypothetical protein
MPTIEPSANGVCGPEKPGDGTIAASARHTADNDQQIAPLVGGVASTGTPTQAPSAGDVDLGAVGA